MQTSNRLKSAGTECGVACALGETLGTKVDPRRGQYLCIDSQTPYAGDSIEVEASIVCTSDFARVRFDLVRFAIPLKQIMLSFVGSRYTWLSTSYFSEAAVQTRALTLRSCVVPQEE
jgi:hypothetical protein